MPIQQFIEELATARLTVTHHFESTGVDKFGIIYVHLGLSLTKILANVALFVCMCTDTVHLEMVEDHSTNKFLQALRRSVARRGRPIDIFADNGTNFVAPGVL